MTDRSQVATRVREVMAQVLDLPPADIGPELSSETSSAWTSLNHLMLISQLEHEFGVVFSNQEIKALTSFAAILDALGRRLDSVA
jgi:acyl carrier protein